MRKLYESHLCKPTYMYIYKVNTYIIYIYIYLKEFKQRYSAWVNNTTPRRHRLLNENPTAGTGYLPMSYWSGMTQRHTKE